MGTMHPCPRKLLIPRKFSVKFILSVLKIDLFGICFPYIVFLLTYFFPYLVHHIKI